MIFFFIFILIVEQAFNWYVIPIRTHIWIFHCRRKILWKSSTLLQRLCWCEYSEKKIPHRHTILRCIKELRDTRNVISKNKGYCGTKLKEWLQLMFKTWGTGCKSHSASLSDCCHCKWAYPTYLCAELSMMIGNYLTAWCRFFTRKIKAIRTF